MKRMALLSLFLASPAYATPQHYALVPIERNRNESILTAEHFATYEKALEAAAHRKVFCEAYKDQDGGANLLCGRKITGFVVLSNVSES